MDKFSYLTYISLLLFYFFIISFLVDLSFRSGKWLTGSDQPSNLTWFEHDLVIWEMIVRFGLGFGRLIKYPISYWAGFASTIALAILMTFYSFEFTNSPEP